MSKKIVVNLSLTSKRMSGIRPSLAMKFDFLYIFSKRFRQSLINHSVADEGSTLLRHLPSGTNGTNSTNGDDSSNASNCRPIFEPFGNPYVASIFIISIFFNFILILVIVDMAKRKIASSTSLFLALAVSDMIVSVLFTLEALMNWCCGSCTFSANVIDAIDIAATFSSLANKGISVYITLKRAVAVSTKLKSSQRKNLIHMIFELLVFALLGCTPKFIILAMYDVHQGDGDLDALSKFGIKIVWLVYSTVLMVVMTVLTIYIFCKLRMHKKSLISNSRHARFTPQDEFEKLVLLVAVSFCCCQFLAIILFSYALWNREDSVTRLLGHCFHVGLAMYAALNLCIYVAASTSFRQSLLGFLR